MKISICIPTFNQSKYLILAINSAINQSIQPYEIIVSDDCSTDETPNVLSSLSKIITNLKIIRNEQNLGISGNTDKCLRQATGDYIIRLDSDDYLSPLFSEKLIKMLLLHPLAGYAHAAVQEIDQDGNFVRKRLLVRNSGFQVSTEALESAVKGYRVAANIIMFRRSALVDVGFITGRPNYVEDYHLSASLAASGYGNVYLNEILSYYRKWVDEAKVRQRRKLLEIIGLSKVFNEVLEPAFKERQWDISRIARSRKALACSQADCLAWEVYTMREKYEIIQALSILSSSSKAKYYAWLYLNGFGKIIGLYNNFLNTPKSIIKNVIFRIKA